MDRKTNSQEKKVEKKVKLPFILLCVAGGLLAGIIICYPIFRIVSFLFTFGSDYTDTNGPDNFSLEV